jgi:hypothetical protein
MPDDVLTELFGNGTSGHFVYDQDSSFFLERQSYRFRFAQV